MSIEILPVGVTCNLRCEYCYEEAGRKRTPTAKYHRKEVLEAAKQSKGFWQLFGGEPLLLNLKDLEELLKLGHSQWGFTGLQTNGSLITPKHIDLFRKYNTQVGISLDGPDDLNDSRWAGTLEATRKATEKTHRGIDLVCELQRHADATGGYHSHGPTLIVTLHSGNCAEAVFPRFKQWIRDLDAKGVRFINFHWLEMDYKAHKWYLDDKRLMECMKELHQLSTELKQMTFLNFNEAKELLRGDTSHAMCVYAACDGWSTAAVQGIANDGSPGNCTRAIKDGIDWLPGEGFGYAAPWQIGDPFPSTRAHVRQLSLYNTPQEHGGCQGCPYFVVCTGYCPGTGLEFEEGREGDWRLRSTHCDVLKEQFADMERKLRGVGEIPITQQPYLKKIEQAMIAVWSRGGYISLDHAVQIAKDGKTDPSDPNWQVPHGNAHGDHTDMSLLPWHKQTEGAASGDFNEHVDQPHGDEHGDHTDGAIMEIPHGDHVDAMHNDDNGYHQPQEYQPHGDHTDYGEHNLPHGDGHGDHTDAAIAQIPHGDSHDNLHGDHTDLGLSKG